MVAGVIEKPESRRSSVSNDSSHDRLYVISGADDYPLALAALETALPIVVGSLFLQQYEVNPVGAGVWEGMARYGPREIRTSGSVSQSFSTTGGTQHITQAKEHIESIGDAAEPPLITPPDFGGAIGVHGDSVDGTDITVPVFNFQINATLPKALMTGAYIKKLFQLTGTVNNAAFKGLAKGEVLFLGASGSQRDAEDWELTFDFAGSPNAVGVSVPGLDLFNKEGWHYVWFIYEDQESNNKLVKAPYSAYVERVYDYGDFSQLGVGV